MTLRITRTDENTMQRHTFVGEEAIALERYDGMPDPQQAGQVQVNVP